MVLLSSSAPADDDEEGWVLILTVATTGKFIVRESGKRFARAEGRGREGTRGKAAYCERATSPGIFGNGTARLSRRLLNDNAPLSSPCSFPPFIKNFASCRNGDRVIGNVTYI